jgi:hypothetical protein
MQKGSDKHRFTEKVAKKEKDTHMGFSASSNLIYIYIYIVEGCALVPPRQFIRTSGGSWALPGAVFSGLGGILGGLGGVLGPLEGVLVSWGRLESFVGRLGGVLGHLGGVLVGNMAPTWLPTRSPNRLKIEAKINQFLDASWDLIFIGFWLILEGK